MCVLSASVLSACSNSSSDRLKVVATAYPLYEATASVGGKHIHAIDLLPLDAYASIPPEKAEQLRTASLAIVLGGGTQPEVDKIVAQRTQPTISILGNGEGAEGELHATNVDNNVWLDPQRMAQIADTVADALTKLVPDAGEAFHKNRVHYEGGLVDVDRAYVETLATCKQHDFLVENPHFSALAHRYGLQQITVGPLDLQTPNDGARQTIDRNKATTVFADSLPSLEDASKIRDLYGVRVAVLDPIATQTDQARRGGASYRVVMDLNLDALRAALSCAPKQH